MNEHSIDKQHLRDLLSANGAALSASNAEGAVAAYAPDGVFCPYNLPSASGTEELLASNRQIFDTIKLDIDFDVREVVVSSDLAYAITASNRQVTALEPGVKVAEENREVFICKRVDGAWKIACYMFNKPAALQTLGA